MYNNSMADAFLNNGAKSYMGYSEYVSVPYDNKVAQDVFAGMVNEGKTAGEAYNTTVQKYTYNDTDYLATLGYSKEGAPAYFKLKGDNQVRIAITGGVENGGFEAGSAVVGWSRQGDSRVLSKLGPLSPTEGAYMSVISTGLGAVDDSDSIIEQTFEIPAGTNTLTFDYNVISEEPTEFIGSMYDDKFEASITFNGQQEVIASESVNNTPWETEVDIDFAGGDETTYMTGWKHTIIDVSKYAGQGAITLRFKVWDQGDSVYDTAALIDNVKLQ